jgi:hypothetical protein
MGWILIGPLALLLPGFVIPVLSLPHIMVSILVHELGAPSAIVQTGGHIAHLTIVGMFLFYVLPSTACFWIAYLLKQRAKLNPAVK